MLLFSVAVIFFVAHVKALPSTLEDIDSINFALGVESFDVASHRPHPPGYPIYIALAKTSTAIVGLVAPSWDRDRRAAVGLAVWSVVAGTLAVFVIASLLGAVGFTPGLAALGATICVASPLFWFSAARPLTDVPGLVAAMLVQTWLVRGLHVVRAGAAIPNDWIWGAAGAGLIIGLRSQTLWLTGPLLGWCVWVLFAKRRHGDLAVLGLAALTGVLVWAVPLVIDSGGLAGYWRSVQFQSSEDLTGIELLATMPTLALFKTALRRTFVEPWLLTGLANAMLVVALAGIARLAIRDGRQLWLLMLLFLPYVVFHLAFHETVTLRYGLPAVVLVAALAIMGFAMFGVRVATGLAIAASVVAVVTVQPRLEAYASAAWPVVRAFQDMARARSDRGETPALRMHHQVWHGVRRLVEWYRPVWDVGPQPFPGDREWLAAVADWKAGAGKPVWFLTDLSRTDMALFDRRSRTLGGRYELQPRVRELVGGYRLDGLNWWRIDPPGWMLGKGWSVTPEIAGMTAADGTAPHQHAAEAFVRRTSQPLRLMMGGRYLATAGSPAGRIVVDLDGTRRAEWPVSASAPSFLHWIDLPDGTAEGPGAYATLTVAIVSEEAGGLAPAVGIEQFDIAPSDQLIHALGTGWFEPEGDPRSGRLWHWMTDRAVVVTAGASSDLRLTLAGESPLRYFDRPPTVVVRAGEKELGRFSPAADFSQTIDIPLAALTAANGQITIETDLAYVPAERGESRDPRRLGLKIFEVELRSR